MDTVEGQEPKQEAPSSGSGMDPKLAALLAYLLGIIGGIVFIVIEKDNKYIRFHAAQSIVFNIAAVVASIAIGIVSAILGGILSAVSLGFLGALIFILSPLLGLGIFIVWIILMLKGYNGYDTGEIYKLPVLGDMAEKIANG